MPLEPMQGSEAKLTQLMYLLKKTLSVKSQSSCSHQVTTPTAESTRQLRAIARAALPLFVAWHSRPTITAADALVGSVQNWRALRAVNVEGKAKGFST